MTSIPPVPVPSISSLPDQSLSSLNSAPTPSTSTSKSSVPLIPTLSRLSLSTTRPALPSSSEAAASDTYANRTINLASRGAKAAWRRSGLDHLWKIDPTTQGSTQTLLPDSGTDEQNTLTTDPSHSTSLVNQKFRTLSLDTSSILYPTLSLHPPPIPHHILIMSLAQVAQAPPTISNDKLFDILIRRLEPWVGEQGDGGYVLILFAAENGEVYGYDKSNEVRKLPGMAWWVWKYKRIPRKYRKNLKRLYIVHPSLFTRTLLPLILPFLSPKSYPKLHPLPSFLSLHYTHDVPLKGIDITLPVLEAEARILHDRPDLIPPSHASRPMSHRQSSESSLTSWTYHSLTSAVGTAASYLSLPSFGSTTSNMSHEQHAATSGYWQRDLSQLVEECGGIPPLLVELRKAILAECSKTMGIFRRTSNSAVTAPIEATLSIPLDAQPNLPWLDIARQTPLFPPKLLGRFLSELRSPVVASELYPLIRKIKTPEEIRTTFLSALPESHRLVLSYLVHMFHHLLSFEATTKMSAFNYATVLVPSLISGPKPLEDAEMCLEPGKGLPEAMRKAMGGAGVEGEDGEERGSGTLVGLLQIWMEQWPVVSAIESGTEVVEEKQTKEAEQDEPRARQCQCQCPWAHNGPFNTTTPIVGTPATAPVPASTASSTGPSTSSETTADKKEDNNDDDKERRKRRSASIRHSLLAPTRSGSKAKSHEGDEKGLTL